MRTLALFIAALVLSACQTEPQHVTGSHLRITSWNLEHLAEANTSGCRPREDADYAALKAYATGLQADVVAFQEVQSVAAAQRVFDPAVYNIVMEARPGTPNSAPPCNNNPGLRLNRQATGFAIRKGLTVERHADVTDLQIGDPNLRSGVDITVKAPHGKAVRLLAVHLKSGCASDLTNPACPALQSQAKVLEGWITQRARERPLCCSGGFQPQACAPRRRHLVRPRWSSGPN